MKPDILPQLGKEASAAAGERSQSGSSGEEGVLCPGARWHGRGSAREAPQGSVLALLLPDGTRIQTEVHPG